MSGFAAISYMWHTFNCAGYLEMPPMEQMERYCETHTSTTHLIFSVVVGEEKALSGVSAWLVTASAQFMMFLCLKFLQRSRPPKHCCYCCPWNAGATSLSPLCYSVLTLQILCMPVWRSGVVCWISKDKYPLAFPICRGLWLWFCTLWKHLGEPVTSFATGGSFLRMGIWK